MGEPGKSCSVLQVLASGVLGMASLLAMCVYTSSSSFSACSIMKVTTEESSRWFAWGEEQSW